MDVRGRTLIEACLVLMLFCADCWAVRPYTPVHPDPVLDSWRWQSFPELKGLGLRCLAEVKDGEKVPSAQRLTPDQERFHASWLGHPVVILRDVKQTRAWVRRMLGTTL